jgi:hypothetical protein
MNKDIDFEDEEIHYNVFLVSIRYKHQPNHLIYNKLQSKEYLMDEYTFQA